MLGNRKYIRILLSVSGLVQGVGFRCWTRSAASCMGLGGYVRNLPDRSVEVMLEGESSQVEKMKNMLRQGPPFARVDGIVEEDRRCISSCRSFFEILR